MSQKLNVLVYSGRFSFVMCSLLIFDLLLPDLSMNIAWHLLVFTFVLIDPGAIFYIIAMAERNKHDISLNRKS